MALKVIEDVFEIQFTNGKKNKKKMDSFKSDENIHKKEDGSYYVIGTLE